jgi:hypothetical protein
MIASETRTQKLARVKLRKRWEDQRSLVMAEVKPPPHKDDGTAGFTERGPRE